MTFMTNKERTLSDFRSENLTEERHAELELLADKVAESLNMAIYPEKSLIASFHTVELKKKIVDHKRSEALIKVIQTIYQGNTENLYYLSDRGDWGESPEIIEVYVKEKNMAVKLLSLSRKPILNHLPEEYLTNNDLNNDRETSWDVIVEFSSFSITAFGVLKSEYTDFLEQVYKNLLPVCFNMKSENEALLFDKINEKLKAESSVLEMKYSHNFQKQLVVMQKNDGSYLANKYISVMFNNDDILLTFRVTTPYDKIKDLNTFIEDLYQRVPDNEFVLKQRKRRS